MGWSDVSFFVILKSIFGRKIRFLLLGYLIIKIKIEQKNEINNQYTMQDNGIW